MNQRDPKLHAAQGLLVVSKDVPRTDALSKVTGAAQYVADLHVPGLLHAAVLRSPHPHARIVSIDVSAAVAMPGVRAVLTGDDTAAQMGCFRPDLYPLAIDKVRYVGDEVAAVAATDAAIARAAVDRSSFNYEVLPAVLSLDEALAPGAPLVHDDAAGNVAHHFCSSAATSMGLRASDVTSKARGKACASGTRRSKRSGASPAGRTDVCRCGATRKRRFSRAAVTPIALGVPESRCASFRRKSAADSAANRVTTTLR